jgi:hypothetical protein
MSSRTRQSLDVRIIMALGALTVSVVVGFAAYAYFAFPPGSLRRIAGPPPLFSFELKRASGFFLDEAGHLMTTRSAVVGCRRLSVAGQGFAAASADIQALSPHPELDLAILQVHARPARAVDFVDVPDPISQETRTAEIGPFNVAGYRGTMQAAETLQQPDFVQVAPQGMVSKPDHSTYLGIKGGLPPSMKGGALIDGRNHVVGMLTGSALAAAPSGEPQLLGAVILSGEVLQLARSVGLHVDVTEAGEATAQPREHVASATAQIFCFRTGFPSVEFYVPNIVPASR